MRICLYGSASPKIDNKFTDKGIQLGKEIAKREHDLVFGGGDTGMMGAVAHGVKSKNGRILGIAPSWINEFETLCEGCDELIKTKSMDERKNLFLEKSDAFIISPGGIGTLDEFFEVFTLKKLKRHNKPIVILNIDNYFEEMILMLESMVKKGFLHENNMELFKVSEDIEDTLNYIENYE